MSLPSPWTLRAAKKGDTRRVFEWANDPVTRAASFQSEPIQWKHHIRWFECSLESPKRYLFIAEYAGIPTALLRFDRHGDGSDWSIATIGVNVSPSERGKGLGTELLRHGTALAGRLSIGCIHAEIRSENVASRRAFEKAGYVYAGEADKGGLAAVLYVIEP